MSPCIHHPRSTAAVQELTPDVLPLIGRGMSPILVHAYYNTDTLANRWKIVAAVDIGGGRLVVTFGCGR